MDTDFKILNDAINNFELVENEKKKKQQMKEKNNLIINTNKEDCLHLHKNNEKGSIICLDCGLEIKKNCSHDKEWRFYGTEDTRRNSDPNRVQLRKINDKNIYKDIENMGFTNQIVQIANSIYLESTKGQIYRGKSRKSIVFGAIFYAHKLTGNAKSHEDLIRRFDLTRKIGLKGLKHINLYAPKTSNIRTTYITPINLIEEIMNKFNANSKQKQEVLKMYEKIKNKSSRLNRARPQSVAAGLTYYWIQKKGKDISIQEFIKKCKLSSLTVLKMTKEIENIFQNF